MRTLIVLAAMAGCSTQLFAEECSRTCSGPGTSESAATPSGVCVGDSRALITRLNWRPSQYQPPSPWTPVQLAWDDGSWNLYFDRSRGDRSYELRFTHLSHDAPILDSSAKRFSRSLEADYLRDLRLYENSRPGYILDVF